MRAETKTTFSFGEFEIDRERRLLLKKGETVNLNPKTFDLLLVLVAHRGEILSKNELLDKVWENQFVEENNLTVHVAALRKALGEKKNEHRFIVTVPGKGYSFVAALDEQPGEIIVETHKFERIVVEEEIEDETIEIETPTARRLNRGKIPRAVKSVSTPAFISVASIGFFALMLSFWFWNGEKQPPRQIELTKLTSNGKVSNATLTSDCKYAVFAQTESEGESLWLRQIETGSQMQILPAKPVEYVGLTISPDGNLIYATVFSGDMPDPLVWRVPLLGGSIEEIKNIKTGASISLSPDGKKFAFTESRSGLKETHFGVANADGSNKQVLIRAADGKRSFPNFDVNPLAWSPDGSEIASVIEEKVSDGAAKAAILLVNPNDGSEKYISERRWDYIGHLAWIDAENLAFVAYRANPWQGQVWTISRETGEARQVTNDLNSYSRLAAAGGNLLTVQKAVVSNVRIADFDQTSNTLRARGIFSESGYISNVAWTNDGRIIYSSTANGKSEIWRVNADGTNPQQLTVNANVIFGISVSPVDGSIIFGSTDDGKHSLRATDAEGKNMRPATEGAEDVFPNFTPDGQAVIFQRGTNNKSLTLWRLNLSDGKITQLTETQASHPTVSPDGTMTAHFFMDGETDNLWRIRLISSLNGAFSGKINLPPQATERRLRWHPGGEFLTTVYNSANETKLLLLPTSGGAQEISGLEKGEVEWFEWSKDGGQLLVSQSDTTHDIILIKSFR